MSTAFKTCLRYVFSGIIVSISMGKARLKLGLSKINMGFDLRHCMFDEWYRYLFGCEYLLAR